MGIDKAALEAAKAKAREPLIKKYLAFVEKTKVVPTVADLEKLGIARADFRRLFGNAENFHEYIRKNFPKAMVNVRDVAEVAREDLIGKYLAYIAKNKKVPSAFELNELGVTKARVETCFGNITKLHGYVRDNYPEEMSVVVDENLFSPKRFAQMKKDIDGTQRFVITTAVVEKPIHMGFFMALKNYCKRRKAKLLILPTQDVFNRRTEFNWTLDPALVDELIVFDNLALNSKLYINAIKLSAKHINPLTGLGRIGQRNGSFIYASPKQSLEYVQVSNKKKIPRAIMTTGAITKNDYSTDKYMSSRISAIAENDHVLGAVVVEVPDNRRFFFRQIQADEKTGAFADLGVRYLASGSVEEYAPQALVLGDWHSGDTDPVVQRVTKQLALQLKPQDIILHDVFDGKAISHWDTTKPLKRVLKIMENRHSLEKEIQGLKADLEDISTWTEGSVVIVKSNHDEFLQRYLVDARYAQDDNNHYYALDLAKAYLEERDPLQFACEEIAQLENPEKFLWLQREEEYKIGGVECGAHGDGWSVTMASLEKALGNAVVGHTHTAGIFRGIFRVGTSSKLQLEYNIGGLSSWTHTHCLVYPNGSRQLINIIGEEYCLK